MLKLGTCIECGIHFTKRPGSLKKYCSLRCKKLYAARQRKPTTKICRNEACRKEFLTFKSNKKFCSIACRQAHAYAKFSQSLGLQTKTCAYAHCNVEFVANRKVRYCCPAHALAQKKLKQKYENPGVYKND